MEKISAYDEDMARRLEVERIGRFEVDKAVRQIVLQYAKRGLKPQEISWFIDYGARCRVAIMRGQPIPTDEPPDV